MEGSLSKLIHYLILFVVVVVIDRLARAIARAVARPVRAARLRKGRTSHAILSIVCGALVGAICGLGAVRMSLQGCTWWSSRRGRAGSLASSAANSW